MNEPGKILFSEVQRFSLMLIAPLVVLFLVAIFLEGHMVFLPAMEAEEPWVWAMFISVGGIAINVLVTLVLIFAKLQTRLDTAALYVRFFPFHLRFKKIEFDAIATVYARIYQPLGEFGGWGIRWTSSGRAYNVSGNRGVQIELKSGRKILIGSQHADELAALLQEAMFHARLSSYAEEQNGQSEQINLADQPREQTG